MDRARRRAAYTAKVWSKFNRDVNELFTDPKEIFYWPDNLLDARDRLRDERDRALAGVDFILDLEEGAKGGR